ncbi:MAG TPA: hypothetical protein VJA18_03455 [Candidatus Nanoarchaeia archaeon]|nr:hypothetical protein [Candidatus Nanoarchaeia archaeon]
MSEKSLERLTLNQEGKFVDASGNLVHAHIVEGPLNLSVQTERIWEKFTDATQGRIIEAVQASAPEKSNAYNIGRATAPVAYANYAVHTAFCMVPILYLRIEPETKSE